MRPPTCLLFLPPPIAYTPRQIIKPFPLHDKIKHDLIPLRPTTPAPSRDPNRISQFQDAPVGFHTSRTQSLEHVLPSGCRTVREHFARVEKEVDCE